MSRFLQRRLVLRFAALSILVCCLILMLREDGKAGLGTTKVDPPTIPTQAQTFAVTVASQPNTPLVIWAARQLPSGEQGPELTFNVTNVFGKTIRAFAIKQDVEEGSTRVSSVSLYNLNLSGADLKPNNSRTDYSTSDTPKNPQLITLSVDYVQFSDGTAWGVDSTKSAEKVAGQLAGGLTLTGRLMKKMLDGNPEEVINAIDSEAASIEPPSDHSEEWKAGFRSASNFIALRLKRAHETGGLTKTEAELNQLARRFRGEQ